MQSFRNPRISPDSTDIDRVLTQLAGQGRINSAQIDRLGRLYREALAAGNQDLNDASAVLETLVGRTGLSFEALAHFWKMYLVHGRFPLLDLAASPAGVSIRMPGQTDFADPNRRLPSVGDEPPIVFQGAPGGGNGMLTLEQFQVKGCEATFSPRETNESKDVLICGFNNLPNLAKGEVNSDHPAKNEKITSELVIEFGNELQADEANVSLSGKRAKNARIIDLKRHSPEKTQITAILAGVKPSGVPMDKDETKVSVNWRGVLCGEFPVIVVVPTRRGESVTTPPIGQKLGTDYWKNIEVTEFDFQNVGDPVRIGRHLYRPAKAFGFQVTTRAFRLIQIQVLDQFGEPLHGVYESENRRLAVCEERFERVKNRRFGYFKEGMEQLGGAARWIVLTNPLARLNDRGAFDDEVSIEYPAPIAEYFSGRGIYFHAERRTPHPQHMVYVQGATKKLKPLREAAKSRRTNAMKLLWDEETHNRRELLENECAAKMSLRVWGHELENAKVRETILTPVTAPEPKWIVIDKDPKPTPAPAKK